VPLESFDWLLMHPRSCVSHIVTENCPVQVTSVEDVSSGVANDFAVTAGVLEDVHEDAVPVESFIVKSGLVEPVP